MQQLLLIAAGGSLGCVARYGISIFVYNATGGVFPWGTLAVNLTGSFIIGIVAELFEIALIPSAWRSFVTIGFVGGYTTFSTYTFETLNLIREGELKLATFNVFGSNVLGVICVALGIYSTRMFLKILS